MSKTPGYDAKITVETHVELECINQVCGEAHYNLLERFLVTEKVGTVSGVNRLGVANFGVILQMRLTIRNRE